VTCCFFCIKIYDKLEEAIEKVILDQGVTSFLVGNQGHFDSVGLKVLRCIKVKYPHISYNEVLAYMPTEKDEWNPYEFGETMLRKGLKEFTHAIRSPCETNGWLTSLIWLFSMSLTLGEG